MKEKYRFEKNILMIEDNKIEFSHEIRIVIPLSNRLIVLLSIPTNDKTVDNVYAVNSDGDIIWRIQGSQIKVKFPYVHITLIDDKLVATDFYGRRFYIDPLEGKITKKDVVK